MLRELFRKIHRLRGKLPILILILVITSIIIYLIQNNLSDWYNINTYVSPNISVLSHEKLILLYKDLFYALYKVTHSDYFINKYGRSKRNPIFITSYYIKVLSRQEFIYDFLKILPLKEIWQKDIPLESKFETVEKLFESYVEHRIKEFELRIKTVFYLFFDISSPFVFVYKNVTLSQRYSVDILTQSILKSYEYQNRNKILFNSIRVMLGFCFICIGVYFKI